MKDIEKALCIADESEYHPGADAWALGILAEEVSKPNAIDMLEDWLYKSKSRSVRIVHDDGYGAGGWEVELFVDSKTYVFAVASNSPSDGKFFRVDWDEKTGDPAELAELITAAANEAIRKESEQ